MFYLIVSLLFVNARAISYPKKIKVESGWYSGFLKFLRFVSSLFDGSDFFGYGVISDFDLTTLVSTNIKAQLTGNLNVTEIILHSLKDIVDQKPMGNILDQLSMFENIDAHELLNYETSDIIGYSAGFGLMCIFLIVFTVLSLFYFVGFFLCCCFFCKPDDETKPSLIELLWFYLSISLIAISVIFMYISSFNFNRVIGMLREFPEFINDTGPVVYNILKNVEESMENFGGNISAGGMDIVKDIRKSLLDEEVGLLGYINAGFDIVKGTVINNNATNGKSYIMYTLSESYEYDENIREEKNYGTVKYCLDQLNGYILNNINSTIDIGFNIDNLVYEVYNIVNTTLLFDEISEKVNDVLNPIEYKLGNLSDIFKLTNFVSQDKMNELQNSPIFDADYVVERIQTAFEIYDKYSVCVGLVLFLLPCIFVVMIALRVHAFHNRNTCSRCISSFSVLYPCLSFLFNFAFGLVFTLLSFVLLIANSALYQASDDVVDYLVDIIDRQVYVPKLEFYDQIGEQYRYLEDISTDPFRLRFSEKTTPIKYLVDADSESNLDEVYGISTFLQLSNIAEWIRPKLERLLSEEQLGVLLNNTMGKQISTQIEDISINKVNFSNYSPIESCAVALGFSDVQKSGSNSCPSTDGNPIPSSTSCPSSSDSSYCSSYCYESIVSFIKKNEGAEYTGYCQCTGGGEEVCKRCFTSILLAYKLNISFSYIEEYYLTSTTNRLNELKNNMSNFAILYNNTIGPQLRSSVPLSAQTIVRNVTDAFSSIFQSVDIQTVRGPLAYLLNAVYYVNAISNCICIVCHFLLIGFFMSTCSMCIRRKGMRGSSKVKSMLKLRNRNRVLELSTYSDCIGKKSVKSNAHKNNDNETLLKHGDAKLLCVENPEQPM